MGRKTIAVEVFTAVAPAGSVTVEEEKLLGKADGTCACFSGPGVVVGKKFDGHRVLVLRSNTTPPPLAAAEVREGEKRGEEQEEMGNLQGSMDNLSLGVGSSRACN